jgi:hypothetical protein
VLWQSCARCILLNQSVLLPLLPQELPASARWVSEAIFTALLLSFIAWTFTPLLAQRSFSTAVLWTRLLTVLVGACAAVAALRSSSTHGNHSCQMTQCVIPCSNSIKSSESGKEFPGYRTPCNALSTLADHHMRWFLFPFAVCQSLRILSFSSTQLPGPAPHCHAGTLTATRPPVTAWWQHLVVDVKRQVANSCGDLIFSSHMTFILTGKCDTLVVRAYGWFRLQQRLQEQATNVGRQKMVASGCLVAGQMLHKHAACTCPASS